jgi:hypothetical protein
MGDEVGPGSDWAGLGVIATAARLLSSSATEPRTVTPAEAVAGVEGCPGPSAAMVRRGRWWPCSEPRQMLCVSRGCRTGAMGPGLAQTGSLPYDPKPRARSERNRHLAEGGSDENNRLSRQNIGSRLGTGVRRDRTRGFRH